MRKFYCCSIMFLVSVFALLGASPAMAIHPQVPLHALMNQSAKVTLPETSIAGPALWDRASTSGGVGPAAVIAWTGTDPDHSLNIETSTDGLDFANKATLSEFALTAPAVLVVNNTTVVIAWVGTDPHHSLNVIYDALGTRQKLTLSDNSDAPPSLALLNGNIFLAWRGTDLQHLLNVRNLGPQGLTVGPATTLTQYTTLAGPSLATDPNLHQLLLSWTDTGNSVYLPAHAPLINFLASTDGLNWHTVLPAPAPQTSIAGPAILAISPPHNFPKYYWSWTGTDPAHSLNLATTSNISNWADPVTTLNEQSFGAPALGYIGTHAGQIFLAWTGVDPDHSLNVAVFTV